MGGHCSTGQSPQWAELSMEEEGLKFKEEISKVLHLEHSLCDAEMWTVGKVDEKYV